MKKAGLHDRLSYFVKRAQEASETTRGGGVGVAGEVVMTGQKAKRPASLAARRIAGTGSAIDFVLRG